MLGYLYIGCIIGVKLGASLFHTLQGPPSLDPDLKPSIDRMPAYMRTSYICLRNPDVHLTIKAMVVYLYIV